MTTVVRPAGAVGYREAAQELAEQYEAVSFEQVHGEVLHLLPGTPSRVLDVGAGTGRDAAALAARGHRVVAVEPTLELRVHRNGGFRWLSDALPELPSVAGEFDLVLVTAVWMHLELGEREAAMRRLAGLLASGGRMLLMLRHGPVPVGRRMFEVSADETVALARQFGLAEVFRSVRPDGYRRSGVTWTHLALEVDPWRSPELRFRG
ncbi:class I SAM-dependent methyltransferase [Kitasatospora camelliae]|uniref:Class I SAM-dependent methyltransferase n=1 Tax=Kitasatospora camelliae TaxID=3156397 RepID=A0AAU8JXN2_9ACTN